MPSIKLELKLEDGEINASGRAAAAPGPPGPAPARPGPGPAFKFKLQPASDCSVRLSGSEWQ